MSCKRYANNFNDNWCQEFPFIKRAKKDGEAECNFCSATFCISDGGRRDITRHSETARHKKNAENVISSSKISSFFEKVQSKDSDKIAAAEGTMAFHTVKHQQSFNSMDCISNLPKLLFDD